MKCNLSPEDLINSPDYSIVEEVSYDDLKSFLIKEIGNKGLIMTIYGIFQGISIAVNVFIITYFTINIIKHGTFVNELIISVSAIFLSFFLIIPIHELIHAAAFLILGKKNIGFGAQWKKFLFYAESDRQVLNRREITIVALAPLIAISLICILLIILNFSFISTLIFVIIAFVHLLVCGGDVAIVSFFYRNRSKEMFTFDDRKLKKTYYFEKNTNQ
ncbi:MAG: DUF3267 domain-containing protein [Prolixibacteraceae bacterium]|nr:DUF3267 domain-containing protein [Prolixibacteraceae bacterium]